MNLLQKKLKGIRQKLHQEKVDAVWIDDSLTVFYVTDFFPSSAQIIISHDEAAVFIDSRYLEEAKTKIKIPVLPKDDIFLFLEKKNYKKIAVNAEITTLLSYEKRKKQLQEKNLNIALLPLPSFFTSLRLIKEEHEKKVLKKAAQIAEKGYLYILSLLKEGITEKEIALEFEIFCRRNGADGLSFPPIIAFGKNSACPHHIADDTKLQKDDIVLMDLGVVYQHYCSDMTRMHFQGRIHPKIKFLYETVKKAYEQVLLHCKEGVIVGTLDQIARDVMRKAEVEDLFLHGLGHGVGLQIHEAPSLKIDSEDKDLLLQKNMVFTVEPGLYLPGIGGVRYEDTIIITEKGYENFYTEE